MKIDAAAILALGLAAVGAWWIFRRRRAAPQPHRTPTGWGDVSRSSYTDSKGRLIVEGFDASGNPRSYVPFDQSAGSK